MGMCSRNAENPLVDNGQTKLNNIQCITSFAYDF